VKRLVGGQEKFDADTGVGQCINLKLAEREPSRLAAVGNAKGFENQARVSTVRRAADGDRPRSGQTDTLPGVGIHAERPFGVGGKLDRHAPVGDGGHLCVALFALRGGLGLYAGGFAAAVQLIKALGGSWSEQLVVGAVSDSLRPLQ
jgi:hypothetical protein